MRYFILMLLLAASSAFATDYVGRQGDDEVRLYESPCVSVQTMILIPEGEREQFQKAQGRFNGVPFFGCWRKMDNVAYIVWEDGDQGIVPFAELKPLLEI